MRSVPSVAGVPVDASAKKTPNARSLAGKLYGIFTPRERIQALLLFFVSLIAALTQAAGVFSVFPFINVVMDPGSIQRNRWLSWVYARFNFTDSRTFMIYLGIAVILMVVFSNAVSAFTMWAKTRYVLGKNHSLSKRLLTIYLSRPYEFFLRENTSDLGKNVLAEINQLTTNFLMAIFDFIINIFILAVIVGMLLMVNRTVTFCVLLFLGAVYGSLNVFIKIQLKKMGEKRLKANRLRFRTATEALSSIKIAKVMGIEPYFISRYSVYSRRNARLNIFAKVAEQLPSYLMESIAFGVIVVFVVITLARGDDVAAIIPLVGLYAFAGKRLMPALQKIYSSIVLIYYNQAILDKIYHDMIEEESETDHSDAALLGGISGSEESAYPEVAGHGALPFNDCIRLVDIGFRYCGARNNTIDHLTVTFKKNTVIGMAGATGSGKTTLVDIVLGLLVPQGGIMFVDETPINAGNLREWQKKIGYVPQEIYLSDDTIRKNIAFGVEEQSIDDRQVRLSARIAAMDKFIETQLPERYDTVIGERGVRLSGGQRQRIGLARALYLNPEILVLDEATSSLDGSTEEAVLKAIKQASRARTVLMIAHRLNTLKNCDQIYIIEKGKFIAHGTYEELIRNNDTFMKMARVGRT